MIASLVLGAVIQNSGDDRALYLAVNRLNYQEVKRRLESGQRPWASIVAPLLTRGSEDKKLNILKLFVEHGLNMKNESCDVGTVVSTAAYFASPRILKYVLQSGGTIDGDCAHTQSIEWRPIYYAILYNEDECVRLLLEYGEDPNVVCKGWTLGSGNPLHLAAYNNMVGKMKILLKYGAKLELVGRSGDTPLLSAVLKPDNVDAVKFLLSKGAKRNAKNRQGETPLQVARRKKYTKLVKVLEGP